MAKVAPTTTAQSKFLQNLQIRAKQNKEEEIKLSAEGFLRLKPGGVTEYYKMNSTLGGNGTRWIYKVTHRRTGMYRALKSISKSASSFDTRSSLMNEVDIVRLLHHPNCEKLFEYYDDNKYFYLIYEFVEGQTLLNFVQHSDDLTEEECVNLFKQLLQAVAYCHSQGVVIGKLNSGDIKFTTKNQGSSLKILGFGHAHRVTDPMPEREPEYTCYCPPETIQDRIFSKGTDLWGLGVILYFMLSKKHPFQKKKQVLEENVKFDGPEWQGRSDECKDLIRKLLERDQDKRIQAVDAFKHPWIQHNIKLQVSIEVILNMAKYSFKNKLREAVLSLQTFDMLNEQQKIELENTFRSLDTQGDGTLSEKEILQGFLAVFPDEEISSAQASRIMKELDKDKSGGIDYSEYITMAANHQELFTKKKITQAFKLLDTTGDGKISRKEFMNSIASADLTEEQWNILLSEIDKNKDGEIDLKEFINIFTKMNEDETIARNTNKRRTGSFKVPRFSQSALIAVSTKKDKKCNIF